MLDSVVWIPTQHFRSSLLVWFRLVWFGLAWFGLVWLGLAWFGLAWFGLAWFGLVTLDNTSFLLQNERIPETFFEYLRDVEAWSHWMPASQFQSFTVFNVFFFGCTFWNNSWFKTENHGVLPSFKFFRRFFGVLGTFFGGPWRFPKRFGVAFAIWKVWTLDGEGKAFLKTESALVQVHGHPKSPGSVQVVTVFF